MADEKVNCNDCKANQKFLDSKTPKCYRNNKGDQIVCRLFVPKEES